MAAAWPFLVGVCVVLGIDIMDVLMCVLSTCQLVIAV